MHWNLEWVHWNLGRRPALEPHRSGLEQQRHALAGLGRHHERHAPPLGPCGAALAARSRCHRAHD
eukprot:1588153-Prymnesium_polylepis.1